MDKRREESKFLKFPRSKEVHCKTVQSKSLQIRENKGVIENSNIRSAEDSALERMG